MPFFFSQIAGGFVLTIAAALSPLLAQTGWDQAASTVVGAAQDAIDGFALTALGRLLELVTQTVGVVLGIVLGLEFARVLGFAMAPPSQALPLGPLALQFVGAAIIAVAVAVYNGAGLRVVVISAVLSFVAWAGFVAASTPGFDTAAASGAGAFLALAVSASLGIYLGQPLTASLRGVTRSRARLRR